MITPEMQDLIDKFIDYVLEDEVGDWDGLREDAPQTAKDAYDLFMQEQKAAHEQGEKI